MEIFQKRCRYCMIYSIFLEVLGSVYLLLNLQTRFIVVADYYF